jgi:hypothetical protein
MCDDVSQAALPLAPPRLIKWRAPQREESLGGRLQEDQQGAEIKRGTSRLRLL